MGNGRFFQERCSDEMPEGLRKEFPIRTTVFFGTKDTFVRQANPSNF
jgi:hypothetical protein